MPLKGIPDSITPELLYALARMGHGDALVIADANFPSDSIASCTPYSNTPIRIQGKSTAELLKDILTLFPLDQYADHSISVMDRVPSDKAKGLEVPAYSSLANVAGLAAPTEMKFIERFEFYETAKRAFVVVQTDDRTLYANCIITKGVL